MTLTTNVQVSQCLDLVFSSDFPLLSDLVTPTRSHTRTETRPSPGQSPEITNFHIRFSDHNCSSSHPDFIRTLLSVFSLSIRCTDFPCLSIQLSSIFHHFKNSFAQTFHYLPLFIAPTWFYAAERRMAKITLQVMCHLYKAGTTIKSHIETQLGFQDCSATHYISV